jgi:hypothetical protein
VRHGLEPPSETVWDVFSSCGSAVPNMKSMAPLWGSAISVVRTGCMKSHVGASVGGKEAGIRNTTHEV